METSTISREERLARIQINSFTYLKADWYARLISVYGSAVEILRQTAQDLSRDGAVSAETAENFLREARSCDPERELELAKAAGAVILAAEDDGYPAELRDIDEPPLLLYVRGPIDMNKPRVAIVGTRKPTGYGRRMAVRLARDTAASGVTVVSGLARGIDSIAHDAVLAAGGVTWAVIGTGLGRCYPAENRKLADAIIAKGGAIVSELAFDKGPMAFHFPRRNRIIAGLSCSVVVVEGPVTSGALITAKLALEQGRDVLAVPGPADCEQSEGPNSLIKQGAGVAQNAEDILCSLPVKYAFAVKKTGKPHGKTGLAAGSSVSPEAQKIVKCLSEQPMSLDQIVGKLGWTVPVTASALFELEASSAISCLEGIYSLK